MSERGKRGRGGLRDEDHALWREVTRSIQPLPQRAVRPMPEPIERLLEKARDKTRATARPHQTVPERAPAPRPPALAAIDRRTKQRLARGALAVDARLDLHGMTQAAARVRLEAFLRSAQAREQSLVLVITGKGREELGSAGEQRGVLRRQVPLWLALPELRPLVVGFSEAGAGHGGAGALYVRVRRRQRM
jgi:DNA-nicking Smr family endonuclease